MIIFDVFVNHYSCCHFIQNDMLISFQLQEIHSFIDFSFI